MMVLPKLVGSDLCSGCRSSIDAGGQPSGRERIAQAIGRELGVVEDQDLIRKVTYSAQY